MIDDRTDMKLEVVVNKGLAVALLSDAVPAGIKLMSNGGVPPEVISRVFFQPQQRRSTDWKR